MSEEHMHYSIETQRPKSSENVRTAVDLTTTQDYFACLYMYVYVHIKLYPINACFIRSSVGYNLQEYMHETLSPSPSVHNDA